MSIRTNRNLVTFDNRETPITEAARINAAKVAARSKGPSAKKIVFTVVALAVALKVAAVAINLFL